MAREGKIEVLSNYWDQLLGFVTMNSIKIRDKQITDLTNKIK